jgi:hypothetical protein
MTASSLMDEVFELLSLAGELEEESRIEAATKVRWLSLLL